MLQRQRYFQTLKIRGKYLMMPGACDRLLPFSVKTRPLILSLKSDRIPNRNSMRYRFNLVALLVSCSNLTVLHKPPILISRVFVFLSTVIDLLQQKRKDFMKVF